MFHSDKTYITYELHPHLQCGEKAQIYVIISCAHNRLELFQRDHQLGGYLNRISNYLIFLPSVMKIFNLHFILKRKQLVTYCVCTNNFLNEFLNEN